MRALYVFSLCKFRELGYRVCLKFPQVIFSMNVSLPTAYTG